MNIRALINKSLLSVFFVFGLTSFCLTASLELGTEYRLRGLAYSNLDYLESTEDRSNYYSQRLRINLIGSPIEDFVIITKLQAIGVAEGSTPSSRYPNTDFSPFVENIYFKLNNFSDLPLNISVGRQPFFYGKGLIVSDDGLGFTGIKLNYKLPWKDITTEVFTAKASESQGTSGDHDLYGIVSTLPGRINTWHFSIFYEKNSSSATYVGGDLVSKDKKLFLDLILDGKMEGAFYNTEIVVQRGSVDKVDPTLPDPTYNSLSYLFEGGYLGYSDKLGQLEVKLTYGEGEGDQVGTTDKIEAFNPTFGRRYDGLERVGYGEFFAASLYDVFQGLNPGYTGLQIISLGGNIAPWAKTNINISYSQFKANEAPPGGAKNLGREMDFGIKYIYSKFVDFRFAVALFFPSDGTQIVGSRATRMMLESNVHF